MKIGCITDTHISFKKSNQIFHNYFEKFYTDIFFPNLVSQNINTVIHLGDAFDNRKGIDYWGLEWAQRIVYDKFKDLGITVYQICGNHDVQMKTTNKHNAIATLLRDYDNVIPIIEPTEHVIDGNKILFLPWICKDNQEKTFNLINSTNSKLIFGHLELSGFTLFPGQISVNGLDKNIFKKFDRVFSGHYHTRSNDGKIYYLGNPYQMFWSDVNDSRGFHIFDTNSYELNFIENPYKLYSKLQYSDSNLEDFNLDEIIGKYIKLIVKSKSDIQKYENFISKLTSLDIVDLKIVDLNNLDDSNFDETEINVEDTITFLKTYIDEADFNLNKEIVKNIVQGIYLEALEMEV